MKSTSKRMLSVLLAVIMVLSVMSTASVNSFAETSGDFSYTVNADGTSCTLTGYSGSEKELAIPEAIDGYTVTALGNSLFSFEKGPEAIIIPKTVTSYNHPFTFSFSQIMKSVTVAEDNPAFSSLDGVLFNKDKTVLEYYPVAREAEAYVVPEGVQSIAGYAFEDSQLVSVKLPRTLKSIGNYAFSHCTELTEIVIPDGTLSIGSSAFRNCEAMKSAFIPDSATDLGSALFYSSAALESVRLPKDIKKIPASMLFECVSVKEFTIPSGVTEIEKQAFGRCTELSKVIIPESVVTIGSNAFMRSQSSGPLTVYGVKGSYAEIYAAEKGFIFAEFTDEITLAPDNSTDTAMIKTSMLKDNGDSAENFTVTFPAEVSIPWGTTVQEIDYTVESHLGHKKALSVSVSGSGIMTYSPDAETTYQLPYTLKDASYTADSPNIYPSSKQKLAVDIGARTWNFIPVEQYSDTLTFTAEVVNL